MLGAPRNRCTFNGPSETKRNGEGSSRRPAVEPSQLRSPKSSILLRSFFSVPFGSVPFGSVRLRSVPFGSVPFVPFGVPFGVPLRSFRFHLVPFRFVPFCSVYRPFVPFRLVPFSSVCFQPAHSTPDVGGCRVRGNRRNKMSDIFVGHLPGGFENQTEKRESGKTGKRENGTEKRENGKTGKRENGTGKRRNGKTVKRNGPNGKTGKRGNGKTEQIERANGKTEKRANGQTGRNGTGFPVWRFGRASRRHPLCPS